MQVNLFLYAYLHLVPGMDGVGVVCGFYQYFDHGLPAFEYLMMLIIVQDLIRMTSGIELVVFEFIVLY